MWLMERSTSHSRRIAEFTAIYGEVRQLSQDQSDSKLCKGRVVEVGTGIESALDILVVLLDL